MKILKYMLMAAALLFTLPACNDDDDSTPTVDNPTIQFNNVDDTTSIVSEITFENRGGSKMVDIHTNSPWQLACDADWLTISNHSGNATPATVHIKITAAENTTGSTRTATLTISGSGKTASLNVVQAATAIDQSGWQTAQEASNSMRIGLNLMNSLDAYGNWFDWSDLNAAQTCWGEPLADAEWFKAVKEYGFNCVRVPITWFMHLDEEGNVSQAWMDRVEEVVNYALNAGLYCIINVHHDTNAGEYTWVKADHEGFETVNAKFSLLWQQIAERFKDYGEKLLFEGYNEVLDESGTWELPKSDNGYLGINDLAQSFVNTVRATGGNNLYRNLIVCTYCANGGQTPLDKLVIPTDQYANHILVEVHNYSPGRFTQILGIEDDQEIPVWTEDDEQSLAPELDIVINYANNNNIPVVIGEFGAIEKIADEDLGKYAEYMVRYCRDRANITLIYWPHVVDRNDYSAPWPLLMQGLLKAND